MPSQPTKLAVLVLFVCSVAAVLSPAFRQPQQDSFPLSNYPMFARKKPSFVIVNQVLAVRADGSRMPLSPRQASGTGEVIQAKGIIDHAVHTGRALALCREAAARLPTPAPSEHSGPGRPGHNSSQEIVELAVATRRFDVMRYFENGRQPTSERIHTRCAAERLH